MFQDKTKVNAAALTPFSELEMYEWFIFPIALERLVDGPVGPDDNYLEIKVKVGTHSYMSASDVHKPNKMTEISPSLANTQMVVKVKKPDFVMLG